MSGEFDFSTGAPSQEMAQYLQMYLDETAEQMDALVESLLVLEARPTDADQLNESFRLIHSIKGSSALMGLDGITVLTHHLENHFERLRSGLQTLDRQSMGLILRCIDFLRECNERLRAGESLRSAPELLEELGTLGTVEGTAAERPQESVADDESPSPLPEPAAPADTPVTGERPVTSAPLAPFRVLVQFESELALADLKAELVLTRLEAVATVDDTRPPRVDLSDVAASRLLEVLISSDRSTAEIRSAADVDGVELIEVDAGATSFVTTEDAPVVAVESAPSPEQPASRAEQASASDVIAAPDASVAAASAEAGDGKSRVVETVRVDIQRLDNLMNLAGELVVNKARFVQIARQMGPAFRKSSLSGRARAFGESMRRAIDLMKQQTRGGDDAALFWAEQLRDLEVELDVLEEQSRLWEESRRGFSHITEAIDQMARVSDNLQRGVLDTRMVPVAPLFNRFKRVVRDISLELGKQVNLEIRGEKTELDKRMIDELGDPLVHLVRNAIDHGLEPADVRTRRGKPETGTLSLEALHSGNNVYISVRDDGGGINVDKVRQKIVNRGLLSSEAAALLTDAEVTDYIWHPGFSTAEVVSDISGRGVGMDIVKTRIAELNGTIDVQHAAGRGTTFTVRLPLTLAIIRSLLFRVPQGVFAVPIDNVREIVSVPLEDVLTVHGRRTLDVRGTFIPLVGIDDLFDWHGVADVPDRAGADADAARAQRMNVIILQSGEQAIGLRVEELHGSQEIVIKSLAENFVHIRGLSGASILGDGSVCLLLDAGAAIAMAADPRRRTSARPLAVVSS